MAAAIYRHDPGRERRRRVAAGARQYVLAVVAAGLLGEEVASEFENALYRYEAGESPAAGWCYTMISQEQVRAINRAIATTERPATTRAVFVAIMTWVRWDTGEVIGTRKQLAEDAVAPLESVSRAMSALVELGVLLRQQRGRKTVYFLNPHVGWAGSEAKRRRAAKRSPAPVLALAGKQLETA
jgi:hypothetical protein